MIAAVVARSRPTGNIMLQGCKKDAAMCNVREAGRAHKSGAGAHLSLRAIVVACSSISLLFLFPLAFAGSAVAGDACSPQWILTPGQPGMDDLVRALAVIDFGAGDTLYAGGNFSAASGVNTTAAARWNADAEQWEFAGFDESWTQVSDFEVFDHGAGDALYASTFTLTRYDGASWIEIPGSPSGVHSGLGAFYGSNGPELFVSGGFFLNTPEGVAEYVARWNGAQWHTAGDGLISVAIDYATFDNGAGEKFYAGGGFGFFEPGMPAQIGLGKWDGTNWSHVGGSTDGVCYAIEVFDDGNGPALYVGGAFNRVGVNTPADNIAKWDGKSWSEVGGGVSHAVLAMKVFDDGSGSPSRPKLYVGGSFTAAGALPAGRIARWDGTSWTTLGGGANDDVRALEIFGQTLAVGGDFTMIAGQPANRIAFYGCDTPLAPGDLDNNGVVDVFDLFEMLNGWGDCASPCPPVCTGDLTDSSGGGPDCMVDVFDLFLLLSNWG